jgi:HPt (histidine-containing phosphotransfer) domain-containing protein
LEWQINEAVAALWERRRDQVMGRVVLVRAAASLRESATPEVTAKAKNEAHRLAGSLGSFGFHEGSNIAAEIEELLAQAYYGPGWTDRLESKIRALRAYMENR